MITIRRPLAALLLVVGFSAALSAQATPQVEREAEEPPRYHYSSIFRIAQDYTVPADRTIPHVQTVFGNVTVEGRVDRDVIVTLGSVRVGRTGVIGGSLIVVGGSAVIEEGGSVREDLVVIGGTLQAPAGFSPHGEHVVVGSEWLAGTLEDVLPWITRGLLFGRLIVPDLPWVWGVVGIFLLLYLTINLVFDRPVAASADVLIERPLSVFMAGLLVLILAAPLLAIVAATVIGLVIVPFLICALFVIALVGKTAVMRAIGRPILRPALPEGRVAATAAFGIGAVVLTLAYMVPILAFVVWTLTSLFGLGAAAITFRSFLRRERKGVPPIAAPEPATPAGYAPGGLDVPLAPAAVPFVAAPVDEVPLPPAPEPPPAPAYTAGLARYPRATFLDRLAAFALDAVLVAIANAFLDFGQDNESYFALLLIYHIGFWAWRGTTLGGIICNVKVVRTDGADLRPVDAVVRGLSGIFSIAAAGIGCLWMLQDPENQMWHDKIAGTLVVKVPRQVLMP